MRGSVIYDHTVYNISQLNVSFIVKFDIKGLRCETLELNFTCETCMSIVWC